LVDGSLLNISLPPAHLEFLIFGIMITNSSSVLLCTGCAVIMIQTEPRLPLVLGPFVRRNRRSAANNR
jgi:hypothetical protein